MRKMIKADLRRILKKPSFYLWIPVIFVVVFLFSGYSDYTDETVLSEVGMIKRVLAFFVTLPVFLYVYGDEMKCGSMQCIIGRGISRARVVIGKFLDCLILSVPYVLAAMFTISLRNFIFEVGTTPTQDYTIIMTVVFAYLRIIGYFAIASFFVFLSWSTAPGVVALITLSVMVGNLLPLLQGAVNKPVYDFYYDGLLEAAQANLLAGNIAYQILPAALYVIGALFLTILVFNKKEIEF